MSLCHCVTVTITWRLGGEILLERVRGGRREERRVTTYVDNIPAKRRLRYLHVNHGLVSSGVR